MKLGIISYGFEKENFEKIKEQSLDFVEFCVNADAENRFQEFYDRSEEIRGNLAALSLFTGSVGRWAGNKILQDGSKNPEEWKADTTLMQAAKKLSCPVYITSCNYVEALSLYENYTAAIAYLTDLVAFGKELGIQVATCNCRWNNYLCCDPAWSVVHGHIKDLWIKYDPSHAVYAKGEDYLSEVKKWGKRFAHVHIKGSLLIDGERFDDPPAGMDQTNWPAFMAALYASGYDKNLSIEPHSAIWKEGALGDFGVDYTIKMMRSLILS